MKSRFSVALCVVLAMLPVLGLAAGSSASTIEEELRGLVGTDPAAPSTLVELVWQMSLDSELAAGVLARVQERHLILTDTLLAILRMPEPRLREQLPALRVLRDDPAPDAAFVPAWRDVRLAGSKLLRAVVAFAPEPRDRRLGRDVDAALSKVVRPQNAAMAGIVQIFEQWWAKRGDDPALTHDPSRILRIEPYLARLDLPADDPRAWQGIGMLTDLDADLVLRERVLSSLSPERHRHLAAELVGVLDVSPDSLVALGVPSRRWDAQAGEVRGHAALDLHRLAHEILDRVTDMDTVDEDDLQRRLQRQLWWRAARYEGRHWRNPADAPSFARFLDGLDRPVADGGMPIAEWLRAVYLEDDLTQTRVFERLGERQQACVADLASVLALDRAGAVAEGFRLSYQSRPLGLGATETPQRIAIDWATLQGHARRALSAITGEDAYSLVLTDDPALQNAAWSDWWLRHRSQTRWYRDGVVDETDSVDVPEFEPERSRID